VGELDFGDDELVIYLMFKNIQTRYSNTVILAVFSVHI